MEYTRFTVTRLIPRLNLFETVLAPPVPAPTFSTLRFDERYWIKWCSGIELIKCLIDILALLLDRPMVFSFLTRDTSYDFEISFFLFFFLLHLSSSITGDRWFFWSLWASIAREPSSSSQKSKAIFLQRATMIYLQRATGCEEKRKEGGREARNETRRFSKFGMIGSAASRDNLSMKRRILGFSFLFVIPFFYRSLFFFFCIPS